MKRLLILILAATLCGCSGSKLAELGAVPKKDKSSYISTLNRYTVSKKLYEEFQTKALITATIFTEQFLTDYSKEREQYSKPEDFNIFLDKEKFLVDNYIRFFVSFYSPKEDFTELEKSTLWNIYLETSDGKKIYPFSIKKAEESKDVLTHYFPYLDYWSKPYFINFKKTDIELSREKTLTLHFISVLGKVNLTFSL